MRGWDHPFLRSHRYDMQQGLGASSLAEAGMKITNTIHDAQKSEAQLPGKWAGGTAPLLGFRVQLH